MGATADLKPIPQGAGLRPPLLGMVSGAAGAAPTPKNRRSPAAPKSKCIEKSSVYVQPPTSEMRQRAWAPTSVSVWPRILGNEAVGLQAQGGTADTPDPPSQLDYLVWGSGLSRFRPSATYGQTKCGSQTSRAAGRGRLGFVSSSVRNCCTAKKGPKPGPHT